MKSDVPLKEDPEQANDKNIISGKARYVGTEFYDSVKYYLSQVVDTSSNLNQKQRSKFN